MSHFARALRTQPKALEIHRSDSLTYLRQGCNHEQGITHKGSFEAQYSLQPSNSPERQSWVLNLEDYFVRGPLPLQPKLWTSPDMEEQIASNARCTYAKLNLLEREVSHLVQAVTAEVTAEELWRLGSGLCTRLLDTYYDFLLTMQHPLTPSAPDMRAQVNSIPPRIWKYSISLFLRLLSQRPASSEYVRTYAMWAYKWMALLYETVTTFEDFWIERLADLSQYQVSIKDSACVSWTDVARSWYSKVVYRNPTLGRIYYRLARGISRDPLQQLCYYAQSSTCVTPHPSARQSISSMLESALLSSTSVFEVNFIRTHALLCSNGPSQDFEDARRSFLNELRQIIFTSQARSIYFAIANLTSLFDYGSDTSALRQIFLLHDEQLQHQATEKHKIAVNTNAKVLSNLDTLLKDAAFCNAYAFTMSTFGIILERVGDVSILSYVYVHLLFLSRLATIPCIAGLVDNAPWPGIVTILNELQLGRKQQVLRTFFPPEVELVGPLPEDYQVRGQIWSQRCFEENYFKGEPDENDQYLGFAATTLLREECILRLGYSLCTVNRWVFCDPETSQFLQLKL